MKKLLLVLLILILIPQAVSYSQVTFTGTFINQKGAKINGLVAVLDIPGTTIASKGEIRDGLAVIKLALDLRKAFKGKIRLKVLGLERVKSQYTIIDPTSRAVNELIFLFSFDPLRKTPTSQYISGDGKIVALSRYTKPITVGAAAESDRASISSIEEMQSSSKTETPRLFPAGGLFTSGTNVSLVCPTDGTTMRYTKDGSTPTTTHGTIYNETISINQTTTLKVIAYKDGLDPSVVKSETYTLKVRNPMITPVGGSYSDEQSVTISNLTGGATIRYTLDGSNPSTTSGSIYTAPFTVSDTTTVKAIAYKDNWQASTVSIVTYKMLYRVLQTKVFWNEPVYSVLTGTLNNGKVFILDRHDIGPAFIGNLRTIEPSGSILTGPGNEHFIDTYYKSVCVSQLSNGKLVASFCAWKDFDTGNCLYGAGKAEILSGTSIIFEPLVVNLSDAGWQTEFSTKAEATQEWYVMAKDDDYLNTNYHCSVSLDNGNVLVAYRHDGTVTDFFSYPGDIKGKIIVFTESANKPSIVHGPKVFKNRTVEHISCCKMDNGNVLITYSSSGGKALVADPLGDVVVAEKSFQSGNISLVKSTKLNNGNVLVVYKQSGGNLTVLDQNANTIVTPKKFVSSDEIFYDLACVTLKSGNALICYKNNYIVVNPQGETIFGPKIFHDGSIDYVSASRFADGNVLVAFLDARAYKGKFVIIEGD